MSRSSYFKSPFEEDFTLKCHFTIHQYICTHKTYLKKPHITHSINCPWNCPAGAKNRCGNMASKARGVQVPELCSKCRPYTLGTDKKLRDIQVFIDNSTAEENKTDNLEELSRVGEPTTELSETREIYEMTLLKDMEKNEAEIKVELGKTNKPEYDNGEQKTEKWVLFTKEASAPSLHNDLDHKGRSWTGSIFSIFAPDLATGTEKCEIVEVTNTDASVCDSEGWQEVNEDPDWDVVNRKEVKRDEKKKLWREFKDSDENWIDVNRT